jgi:dsRNA-specific ribonuclease
MTGPENAQRSIEAAVANGNLAVVGRQLGLPAFINTNPSQKGVVPDKLVSDTMEALLGAAKLDGAHEATLEGIMRRLQLL